MNILKTIKSKTNNTPTPNAKILKNISKAIFITMVFSQTFFTTSTFNWNPSFSFGIHWLNFIQNQAGLWIIIFCFLTKKLTKLEVKCYALILIFSLLFTQIRYFRWEPIYILATAMIIRDENDRWVANTLFWTHLTNFTLTLALPYFNITQSVAHYYNGILRYSLGFIHPNTTIAMALAILITYLLKKKNNPSLYVILPFIPALMILNQHLSITIFMPTCILALKLLEKLKIKLNILHKHKTTFINILPFLFLLTSYFLSFFFTVENRFFRVLDQLFTWRLASGRIFVYEYPITLWGVNVYQNAHDPVSIYIHGYRLLDTAFLSSLLMLGLIYTILRFLYFSWLGNEMTKRGYKYIPIILTGIFLFGFMESFMWSPAWNILFLFGAIFLKEYATNKEGTAIPNP